MVQTPGLMKLKFIQMMTLSLVFGVIAGILGLVLWYSGASGFGGILIAVIFSFIILFIQWLIGPKLIKMMTRMRKIEPNESPRLDEMISQLASKAEIPKPTLYIVDDQTPNAFAFGRTQGSAGIAVHTGLLKIMNEQEIEAVLAHEVGHIKHRDVFVMTLASVLPIMIYYIVLVMGSSRDNRRGGAGNIILIFLAAQFASFLGRLLVMWLSRQREYYADAFSAYTTNNPTGLMTSLAKISYSMPAKKGETTGALSAFYISDPSPSEKQSMVEIVNAMNTGNEEKLRDAIENEKKHGHLEIFMTHPLTAKRLDSLNKLRKNMGG